MDVHLKYYMTKCHLLKIYKVLPLFPRHERKYKFEIVPTLKPRHPCKPSPGASTPLCACCMSTHSGPELSWDTDTLVEWLKEMKHRRRNQTEFGIQKLWLQSLPSHTLYTRIFALFGCFAVTYFRRKRRIQSWIMEDILMYSFFFVQALG